MNTIGKTSVALLSGVLMSLPAFLLGDVSENQIIYVNLPKLMEESLSGQEKRSFLETLQSAKATDINDLSKSWEKAKTDLEKTKKDLVAKRSTLSPEAIKKEEKKIVELERKVEELQHKLQLAYQDADAELKNEWMQVTESLFKEQVAAITEWAKEKKAYAVIDRESGRVLYCREQSDMTGEVLKVVNKKHTEKTVLAKNAAPALPKLTKVA